MYEYEHRDRFYLDGTYRQYFIECGPLEGETGTITLTNEDLVEESLKIIDAIMTSDTLTFSNCMSTSITFITTKKMVFKQRIITLRVKIDDYEDLIPIGTFYVDQDTISRDGRTREITAYDKMFFLINLKVTDWYNSLTFPITIKEMRDSLCELFEIEQNDSILINDDISLPKQISEDDDIYGSDIIKSICDLNATFAHINRDGVMTWIMLETEDIHALATYPSTDETFPIVYPGVKDYDGILFEVEKRYYVEDSIYWESYPVLPADGVEIRDSGNVLMYQTNPYAINPYIITDNQLTSDLSSGQYETIANRLYEYLKDLTYIPFEGSFMTDPCTEVGDRINVHTQDDTYFLTYVLSKQSSGMQVPFDKVVANGSLLFNDYKGDETKAKLKNLDKRTGKGEKSSGRMLQIRSVAELPANPELNVLYLVQGEVVVR